MNRHLDLGLPEPIVEGDYEPLTEAEAAVWDEEHPAPRETGIPHERRILAWLDDQSTRWLRSQWPESKEDVAGFHDQVECGFADRHVVKGRECFENLE